MKKLGKQDRLLLRKINKAFATYPMLDDGDKVAVAVSGGYDSMSLLRLLQMRRAYRPERYEIIALHVLGDAKGPHEREPHKPLLDWLETSGVRYIVEPMHLAEGEKLPMNCQRCTWNRRSTLFRLSNRLGCNKLALGHNLDDMAETVLLNLLYQGRILSMYPYASYFGGMFHLIRPLVFATKRELNNFAIRHGFPDPPPECPNADTSKRKVIADILKLDDNGYQNMRLNVFRAAMRCMEMEDGKEDELT
jgi:tRNA 2-thiocytidine biosynthesis protein TtcA